MKRIPRKLLLGVVLALVLAGCGGGVDDGGPIDGDDQDADAGDPDDMTDPDDEAEPGDATDDQGSEPEDDTDDTAPESEGDDADDTSEVTPVRLYFIAPGGGTLGRADPFLISVARDIPSTPGIALATLRELVEGPSTEDVEVIDGVATAVPDETLVLGVNLADGVATVDLSREFESGGGSFSMFSRLAQIVYTATQFPTVDEVQFRLDGQPVTVFSGEGIVLDEPVSRADYLDLLPTVFVDTPATGAEADTPLRVTGMAAVFEATFLYRLESADGAVLDEGFAMSDNGMGWGAFDITLDVAVDEPTEATLTVWEESAKDGSVQALRETPLTLLP